MSRFPALCLAVILSVAVLCPGPARAERFLNRQVEITDARSTQGTRAPVVIALHGFLGTPRNMRRKTGLDALARRHGFIAVYPEGRARRWNDGRIPGGQVDDVQFLSALIAALIAEGRADPARIYLAGHSNGGGMALRMACARPDLVAGIAIVATKAALGGPCPGGPPVPAIFFHGTADPITPHGGRAADSRLGGALSSADTLAQWAARNRCTRAGPRQEIDAQADGTSVGIVRYRGCAARLTFVELVGHGHGWPALRRRGGPVQGPASTEIDASALIWRFFDGR